MENAEPFGRGERGVSHVFITKDRPGYLRRHGRPNPKMPGKTFMGTLAVDDTRTWAPNGVDLTFIAPVERDDTDAPDDEQNQQHGQDDLAVLSVVSELEAAEQQAEPPHGARHDPAQGGPDQ